MNNIINLHMTAQSQSPTRSLPLNNNTVDISYRDTSGRSDGISSEEDLVMETPFLLARSVASKRNNTRNDNAFDDNKNQKLGEADGAFRTSTASNCNQSVSIQSNLHLSPIKRLRARRSQRADQGPQGCDCRHTSSHQCPSSSSVHIPDLDSVTHNGTILLRTKKKGFIFRRTCFIECQWLKYGTHRLLFFQSRNDMYQWLYHPSLSNEERQQLVFQCIDFEEELVSASFHILGYKNTMQYMKRYKQEGNVFIFKVFQWRLGRGEVMGAFVPVLAGAFASKNCKQVNDLFDVVNDILKSTPPLSSDTSSSMSTTTYQHQQLYSQIPINHAHQRRIYVSSTLNRATVNKIRHFNALEYHDDFADWLLQAKLEESGFLMATNTPDIISTNITQASMAESNL